MIIWEYAISLVEISIKHGDHWYVDPSRILTEKNEEGIIHCDDINQMGEEGWELISVTPFEGGEIHGGVTDSVLFTFKRPKQ